MSTKSRVGMPAQLHLMRFGQLIYDAFGDVAYWVGSSLESATWRDVDVRLMLSDSEYLHQGYGDPGAPHTNAKWCANCAAWSALGKEMTGLPVDFQIQDTTLANKQYQGKRSALFTVWDSQSRHMRLRDVANGLVDAVDKQQALGWNGWDTLACDASFLALRDVVRDNA